MKAVLQCHWPVLPAQNAFRDSAPTASRLRFLETTKGTPISMSFQLLAAWLNDGLIILPTKPSATGHRMVKAFSTRQTEWLGLGGYRNCLPFRLTNRFRNNCRFPTAPTARSRRIKSGSPTRRTLVTDELGNVTEAEWLQTFGFTN